MIIQIKSIEWKKTDKLTILRDKLRKNNIITEAEGKQIGFWIDVGNNAAHGNLKNLNNIQIKNMLDGLYDFIRLKMK